MEECIRIEGSESVRLFRQCVRSVVARIHGKVRGVEVNGVGEQENGSFRGYIIILTSGRLVFSNNTRSGKDIFDIVAPFLKLSGFLPVFQKSLRASS
jgi:hypothetical protein